MFCEVFLLPDVSWDTFSYLLELFERPEWWVVAWVWEFCPFGIVLCPLWHLCKFLELSVLSCLSFWCPYNLDLCILEHRLKCVLPESFFLEDDTSFIEDSEVILESFQVLWSLCWSEVERGSVGKFEDILLFVPVYCLPEQSENWYEVTLNIFLDIDLDCIYP